MKFTAYPGNLALQWRLFFGELGVFESHLWHFNPDLVTVTFPLYPAPLVPSSSIQSVEGFRCITVLIIGDDRNVGMDEGCF